MSLTLRQIEAFHAVMAAGSVTRAAAMLNVSQPSVSRIIADLEAELGFLLFERANRMVVPTEEARVLHEEVERTFLGLAHIDEVARGLRDHHGGQLRLITIPSLMPLVAETLIGGFLREFPNASISLEVQTSQRVFEWVVSQHCDVGIATRPVFDAQLEARKIGETAAACVLPHDHRLAKRRGPVHASDLQGETFVSYKPDSMFRRRLDQVFEEQGVTRHMRLEARTTEAVCNLAAAVRAVSVIPSPGPHAAQHRSLTLRPFRPAILSEVVLVSVAHRPLTRVARAFVDYVDRAVALGWQDKLSMAG